MTKQATKLTVSVPADLITIADELAKEKNISRSKLVAMCLEELAEKHLRGEMAEGYKAMAKEQQQIARLTLDLQKEIVSKW